MLVVFSGPISAWVAGLNELNVRLFAFPASGIRVSHNRFILKFAMNL
jgi:hypothetical protein